MHKDDPLSNLPPVENTDSSVIQPNSATVDFDTDAGHQGIFSGNDTRIETENLPEIVPEVVQQAPMSSISPTLRTTSTITGDLHIGGTTKKKKWPFIALGVVAVVAIIGGVILFGNQKGKSSAEGEVQTALDQFSNYYLYGTESTDVIQGDYDRSTVYRAVVAMEERDIEFFDKARSYYDAFIQAYEQNVRTSQEVSDSENVDDYFDGNIASFTQMFDFIYHFVMAPALTSEEIFDLFINTDIESAQQFINDYYSSLSDTSYELGIRYAKERTVYDLAQIDRYYIYQDSGCIDGNNIKDDCSVSFKNYDTTRIEEAAQIADSDILQLPDDATEDSIELLYLIQKEKL